VNAKCPASFGATSQSMSHLSRCEATSDNPSAGPQAISRRDNLDDHPSRIRDIARRRGAAFWRSTRREKPEAEGSMAFEEVVFLIGHGHVLDILEHRINSDMVVNGSSSSSVTITCPRAIRRRRQAGCFEDDHSKSQGHEAVLGERAGRS
jgi:hypothetical protein